MRVKKVAIWFLIIALLLVAGAAVTIVQIENWQFRRNAEMANYEWSGSQESKILVAYFSRSGNTELMAMEIAKHYNANLVHLEAEDYRIGFRGLLNALKDSQSHHAVITPEKVDLSPYETIFIGSPIWWYSPAPPVWQFVESNDFTDKGVVLFNTFNSRFKQKYIDLFKEKVKEKHGRFLKHIYIKRERMPGQIGPQELLEKVRFELKELP